MKYQKAVNIWAFDEVACAKLQPGQWVYAGNPADKGVYLGVKASGSIVVAWYANAKRHKSFAEYRRTLRDYAKS